MRIIPVKTQTLGKPRVFRSCSSSIPYRPLFSSFHSPHTIPRGPDSCKMYACPGHGDQWLKLTSSHYLFQVVSSMSLLKCLHNLDRQQAALTEEIMLRRKRRDAFHARYECEVFQCRVERSCAADALRFSYPGGQTDHVQF